MPKLDLKSITGSPVLLVGVAGAGLVGAVYIFSKNRPNVETVGGQMPFSWDALANWLGGREGGPGDPGDPGEPTPTPGPFPHPGPIPRLCMPGFHVDPTTGECVQDGTPYDPPPPLPHPGPLPRPRPEIEHDAPQSMTDDPDLQMFEAATGRGGGRQRIFGLTRENLWAARYNGQLWAHAVHRQEEQVHGGGH